MRAGDIVSLKDGNLQLVVGAVNESNGAFIACGWPHSPEKIERFEVTEEATNTYHIVTLRNNYDANDSQDGLRHSYARAEILASNNPDPWIQENKTKLKFKAERNTVEIAIHKCQTKETMVNVIKALAEEYS